MNDVMLLANHKTSLRTMVPLGQYFKEHSGLNPVLLLLQSDRMLDVDIRTIGFDWDTTADINESSANSKKNILGSYYKHIKTFIYRFGSLTIGFLWPLARYLYIRQLKRDFKIAKFFFEKYEPKALVLPDDRTIQLLPFIKTAKDRGVPTIVVPVSFSNQTGVSLRRINKKEYQIQGVTSPVANKILAKRNPLQIHEFKGVKILFFQGVTGLALESCGMLPTNPWVLGGGDTDYLLVDGYDAEKQAISLGVPEGKITVSGHISHDDLYSRNENRSGLSLELLQKYHFNEDKKLIICAVPHLAEHGMISWSKHWKDVEILVGTLVKTGHNTLLSLHPKSDINKYEYLEEKFNCRIAKEKLDEIIVASWLFVAGYSSTIRWAVLCGIPAMVVDFNAMGYDLFDHWDGVIKVNSYQEFSAALERVLGDEKYYQELGFQQQRISEKLTIFDGNAHKRIIHFIENCLDDGRESV